MPVTAGIPNDYTVEKTVTQEEYDALIEQGFCVEVINSTDGGLTIRICNPVMGVPISFLDKYCPEQFEIVGLDRYTVPKEALVGGRVAVAGKPRYARILIRGRRKASV